MSYRSLMPQLAAPIVKKSPLMGIAGRFRNVRTSPSGWANVISWSSAPPPLCGIVPQAVGQLGRGVVEALPDDLVARLDDVCCRQVVKQGEVVFPDVLCQRLVGKIDHVGVGQLLPDILGELVLEGIGQQGEVKRAVERRGGAVFIQRTVPPVEERRIFGQLLVALCGRKDVGDQALGHHRDAIRAAAASRRRGKGASSVRP